MTSPKSQLLWVGTSWKMNKTLAEADLLIRRRPGAPAAEAGEMVEVINF